MYKRELDIVCPNCKKIHHVAHSNCELVKIRNRGNDNYYTSETCPDCGHKFYRISVNETILNCRKKNLPLDVAFNLRMKSFVEFRGRRMRRCELDLIRNFVKSVYDIPEEDLCIDKQYVLDEDIIQ